MISEVVIKEEIGGGNDFRGDNRRRGGKGRGRGGRGGHFHFNEEDFPEFK